MITRKLLKAELDKVQEEYLEALFQVIKAIETPIPSRRANGFSKENSAKADPYSDWPLFIEETYGCLANDPIKRGDQRAYEIRECLE